MYRKAASLTLRDNTIYLLLRSNPSLPDNQHEYFTSLCLALLPVEQNTVRRNKNYYYQQYPVLELIKLNNKVLSSRFIVNCSKVILIV